MTEKNKLQLQVNERIERFIDNWNDMQSDYELSHYKRLFTCSAYYRVFVGYADETVVLLQSNNTIVAAVVINGKEKRGYDFLRYVYGYTSTSAQHISKFFRLFNVPYTNRFIWRYVKGVKQ